jgi:hypothetical protein
MILIRMVSRRKQEMLVRMRGKSNPYTLLVSMQISALTIEISVEVPPKANNIL